MFVDFRERGRERERNTDVREKRQLVASCMRPEVGVEPAAFWCVG